MNIVIDKDLLAEPEKWYDMLHVYAVYHNFIAITCEEERAYEHSWKHVTLHPAVGRNEIIVELPYAFTDFYHLQQPTAELDVAAEGNGTRVWVTVHHDYTKAFIKEKRKK